MEDPFKQTIYAIFKMAGEFPLQVVYTLWKHDQDVYAEMSLYDTIINSIIGYTFTTHADEFKNESGELDNSKYMDYKLEKLKDAKDKIKYTLNLTLTKSNKRWILNDITETDRQKIHGLYNS